jgi:N-acetylglucosamine kinase-like BadF-type ATPase
MFASATFTEFRAGQEVVTHVVTRTGRPAHGEPGGTTFPWSRLRERVDSLTITMTLYLCVDCGGSKTSAVISNEHGKILGRALGGPSNFAYIGVESFVAAVEAAVSDALKTCVDPASTGPVVLTKDKSYFAKAWFGVSGVDSPSAVDAITPALSELVGIPPGSNLSICNDTYLLAAPLHIHEDVKYVVATIGGTGATAVGFREDEDGNLKEFGRVGGWGWLLGDEGGGFHVGRTAIRTIVARADRDSLNPDSPSPPSTLVLAVLEKFGAKVPHDLLALVHLPELPPTSPPPEGVHPLLLNPREKRLSSLSPIVFRCAFEDHDPLALKILTECADSLAEQIAMFLIPTVNSPPGSPRNGNAILAGEAVLSFGGSLVGIGNYRELVLDRLKKRGQVFKYVEFVDDPAAVGALSLAMHA